MKKLKLINLVICCLPFLLNAQIEIQGIIADSITSQPIGFVNIGIMENTNGTVSDEDGIFRLQEEDENATARLSSIGYFNKSISLRELQLLDTIFLTPQTYEMQSIQVNSKKFGKEVIRGKKVKSKNSIYGWDWSDQMGREIGIKVKIKEESFIKSAHFGLHKNSSDSIWLRVNIYEFKDGIIGENLMPENVIVKTGNIDKYIHVDLSHLNIVVDHDVLLALETVKEKSYDEKKTLYFRIALKFKTNIYERLSKAEAFEKFSLPAMKFIKPIVGFYLTVKETK